MDARLTPKGMAQCASLAQHTENTMMNDLKLEDVAVVTSPMTRCVQTALYSFPWLASVAKVPFVALESVRETVNYACDRRRTIAEISKDFPRVDFANCKEDSDFIWDAYRRQLGDDWDTHMESAELYQIAHRAREGFWYLQNRPEHHLFVCSHSGEFSLCYIVGLSSCTLANLTLFCLAFLRCILNWGQVGGVPQLMAQVLDQRDDKTTNHKLFEFCGPELWKAHMRSNYENCELRSFCMLVQDQ